MLACQSVVKVLSPDDGRLSIVQAAQQLCRAVEQKEKTSKDINVTVLDSLLRGEFTACLSADKHKPTVRCVFSLIGQSALKLRDIYTYQHLADSSRCRSTFELYILGV